MSTVRMKFSDGSFADVPDTLVNKAKAVNAVVVSDDPASHMTGIQAYFSAPGIRPLPGTGVSIPTGAKPYLDAAPGTLGMIGSELGTPFGPGGRAAGAAIGGGLGTAAQMVGNNLALGQPYPAHPMNDIAQSAGGQAAASLTGDAAVKGLGMMANPIMRYATRGTEKVAETALKLRAAVGTPIPKPTLMGVLHSPDGLAVANHAITLGSQDLSNAIGQATKAGVTFDHSALLPALQAVVKRGNANALSNEGAQAGNEMIQTFLSKYGPGGTEANGTLTPEQLQTVKQEAQDAVRAYYEQFAASGKVPKSLPAAVQANRDIASAAQKMLETIPGVKEANQGIGNAIALRSALTKAANKPIAGPLNFGATTLGAGAGVALHSPLEGAAIGLGSRALTDPWTASRLALGMTHPIVAPAVDAAGHAAASALFPWRHQ